MREFLDRLEASKKQGHYQVRSVDNELEAVKLQELKEKLEKDVLFNKRMQPTYWNDTQEIIRDKPVEQGLRFKAARVGKKETFCTHKYSESLADSPLPFAR